MEEIGADTEHVFDIINKQKPMHPFNTLTLDTVKYATLHELVAFFTFGREDIIPIMFDSILEKLNVNAPILKEYMRRHIQIDGEEHSHMGMELLEYLCGEDQVKWEQAKNIARTGLQARIQLWDEVLKALIDRHTYIS